jgi:hypothetical protein
MLANDRYDLILVHASNIIDLCDLVETPPRSAKPTAPITSP